MTIQSENHGEHTFEIDNGEWITYRVRTGLCTADRIVVYKTPSEAERKFDYIICCHKAINVEATPPLFQDYLAPSVSE